MTSPECIFCKIAGKEISSLIVYEDEFVLAFLDIKPVNLGHTLVIPKNHYENLYDCPDKTLEVLAKKIRDIAIAVKKGTGADGINIEMNNERSAGQIIDHAHFHIIPRMAGDGLRHWQGKEFSEKVLGEAAQKIKNSF